jgi:hypothetical protein
MDYSQILSIFAICKIGEKTVGKTSRILSEKLGIRTKLGLSLSAIAAMLLVSSIISVMMYVRMSNYVTGLMSDNIQCINTAQSLAAISSSDNLDVLAVIGDDIAVDIPDLRETSFLEHCDSLKLALKSQESISYVDTVIQSFSQYSLTCQELANVLQSDFIDTRSWYFERLQPVYDDLRSDIDALNASIYDDLNRNAGTFERGFYRSIIPAIVAVGVGLLLIVMLFFFLNAYYVSPLYKMLTNLKNYRDMGKKYNLEFDGDDQLSELNAGITDITSENQQLRKRLNAIRQNLTQQNKQ